MNMSKGKHGKSVIRKVWHRVWVTWEESSAVMYGVSIEVPREDHYVRSPLITEVSEHREIHASERA
jgi:hypothetical protein